MMQCNILFVNVKIAIREFCMKICKKFFHQNTKIDVYITPTQQKKTYKNINLLLNYKNIYSVRGVTIIDVD